MLHLAPKIKVIALVQIADRDLHVKFTLCAVPLSMTTKITALALPSAWRDFNILCSFSDQACRKQITSRRSVDFDFELQSVICCLTKEWSRRRNDFLFSKILFWQQTQNVCGPNSRWKTSFNGISDVRERPLFFLKGTIRVGRRPFTCFTKRRIQLSVNAAKFLCVHYKTGNQNESLVNCFAHCVHTLHVPPGHERWGLKQTESLNAKCERKALFWAVHCTEK